MIKRKVMSMCSSTGYCIGQIFQVFNEYLEKYNSDPYYISDEEYVKEFEKFVDKLTDANIIF